MQEKEINIIITKNISDTLVEVKYLSDEENKEDREVKDYGSVVIKNKDMQDITDCTCNLVRSITDEFVNSMFEKELLKKKIEKTVYTCLENLTHKRFNTIDDIVSHLKTKNGAYIKAKNGVYKVGLCQGSGDIVCDNYLIGTIGITNSATKKLGREFVEYDFQLYYIKDNLGNFYITEIELLEEVE